MKTVYIYDDNDARNIVAEIFKSGSKIHERFPQIYNRTGHFHYIKTGAGFDIETTKIVTTEYATAYCYHWQFSIDEYIIMGRELCVMECFIRRLIARIKMLEHAPHLMVLVANLGYEWQFCKTYWHRIGISSVFAKQCRDPLKIELDGCIEFREIIGLFGYSLDDIARNYTKTQKLTGDLDYSKIRGSETKLTDQEIQYCINDVKILQELGGYIMQNFSGDFPVYP